MMDKEQNKTRRDKDKTAQGEEMTQAADKRLQASQGTKQNTAHHNTIEDKTSRHNIPHHTTRKDKAQARQTATRNLLGYIPKRGRGETTQHTRQDNTT